MLVFNNVISSIIKSLEDSTSPKYDLFEMNVQYLMYADDMAIVANNKGDLQKLLDVAIEKKDNVTLSSNQPNVSIWDSCLTKTPEKSKSVENYQEIKSR